MLVFDLESDGLLDDVTRIHCLVIYDTEVDETIVYNDQGDCEPISRGVQRLEDATLFAAIMSSATTYLSLKRSMRGSSQPPWL